MSQVLVLDMPTTLAGNLAPIGCEYQGIRGGTCCRIDYPLAVCDESLGPVCSAIMDGAS